MSLLNQLVSITTKPAKRIGRGYASGKGSHTVGRGVKGQTSRVGDKNRDWFEGGQLPLVKRLPMMRGKSRLKSVRPTAEITLSELNRVTTSPVTYEALRLAGLVPRGYDKAKVVASGKITKAVTLKGVAATPAAQKSIEAAGGSVE